MLLLFQLTDFQRLPTPSGRDDILFFHSRQDNDVADARHGKRNTIACRVLRALIYHVIYRNSLCYGRAHSLWLQNLSRLWASSLDPFVLKFCDLLLPGPSFPADNAGEHIFEGTVI